MNNIKEKLNQTPKFCGVYIFKDKDNKTIYVGKAKNLYNRVNSYFLKSDNVKTQALRKKIKNVEFFVTNNEVEALLLENNLIKKFQPKYNIQLKDSKSYPMIKITNELLPRIIKCREKTNNKDEYFGPFISVGTVRYLQKIFTEVLKIRPCNKKFKPPLNHNPCLNYHIEKCSGPCASIISTEDYLKSINMAKEILKGNTKSIIQILNKKMQNYSTEFKFEAAAKVRDQIKILEQYEAYQYIDIQSKDDSDYVGIYSDFKNASISVIKQREGKVIDKKNFMIKGIIDYTTVVGDFLNTYYLNTKQLPNKIFIQDDFDDKNIFEKAIMQQFNKKIIVKKPYSIKEKRLLILAKENSELYFEERQYKLEKIHELRELKKLLSLPKLPRVIEGFDIATLNGKFNTAALVNFLDGKPNKTEYRQFNIQGQGHPDDYLMMEEAVTRRYQKLKNENLKIPDLILIDGGLGQVNSAKKILDVLDMEIPVIGLAKKNEYIFKPGNSRPIILSRDSIALKLLQRVRDEAHRFSNTRLKKRYTKKTIYSNLLKIQGVGEKRINLLFKKFGSINNLINSTQEEIAEIDSIGIDLADKIFKYFHPDI